MLWATASCCRTGPTQARWYSDGSTSQQLCTERAQDALGEQAKGIIAPQQEGVGLEFCIQACELFYQSMSRILEVRLHFSNQTLQSRVSRTTRHGVGRAPRDPVHFFMRQMLKSFIRRRLVKMALWVESHVSKFPGQMLSFGTAHRKHRQGEVRRAADDKKARRLDAEEAANDVIGDLVIFGAADAMNEQIAQDQPREHGGQESAWPQRVAIACHGQKRGYGSLGLRRKRWPGDSAGAKFDHVLAGTHEQARAAAVTGAPGPERQFEPVSVGGQIRYGMITTTDSVAAAM